MKAIYKGHEIEAKRERCLAGYALLYWSIFRQSDGFEYDSGCEDSAETVRSMIGILKERVDNELQEDDPWLEREGLHDIG